MSSMERYWNYIAANELDKLNNMMSAWPDKQIKNLKRRVGELEGE